MSDPRPIPLETVKFSPLLVNKIVLEVLRYFFSNTPMPDLRWDQDPKLSKIFIGTVNDITNPDDQVQKQPRILFSRGPYVIQKTSLTGDLAEAVPSADSYGLRDSKHMNLVSGQITIIIEAYEEGTCELLADMVSTFFTWSSDHICNMYRFKQFGYPMGIQECTLDKENREKFKIVLNTSYMTETCWQLKEDAIKLKGLLLNTESSD